jgi:Domain of unknown function (DUF4112)
VKQSPDAKPLEGEWLPPETPGQREARERLRLIAWLLDSSIPIPGTRFTIGIDALVGLIPFLGDLFDAAWKANVRNVRLLEAWAERPHQIERGSRWFVVVLTGALLLFLAGCTALTWLLLRWLLQLF